MKSAHSLTVVSDNLLYKLINVFIYSYLHQISIISISD